MIVAGNTNHTESTCGIRSTGKASLGGLMFAHDLILRVIAQVIRYARVVPRCCRRRQRVIPYSRRRVSLETPRERKSTCGPLCRRRFSGVALPQRDFGVTDTRRQSISVSYNSTIGVCPTIGNPEISNGGPLQRAVTRVDAMHDGACVRGCTQSVACRSCVKPRRRAPYTGCD